MTEQAQFMDGERLKGFNILFCLAQALGLLCIILVGVWIGHYAGGVGWWPDTNLEFNWHPILMTVGFIYLYGNSILIYRSLRPVRKPVLKLVHAIIPLVIMVLVCIAIVAAYDMHQPPILHLFSVHGWLGLVAIILFFLQWLAGLLTFLYPGAPMYLRATFMPYHIYCGLTIFILVIAAALTGLLEKSMFRLGSIYFTTTSSEGLLVNFISLFIFLFAALVVYIATVSGYKRAPRPQDGLGIGLPE